MMSIGYWDTLFPAICLLFFLFDLPTSLLFIPLLPSTSWLINFILSIFSKTERQAHHENNITLFQRRCELARMSDNQVTTEMLVLMSGTVLSAARNKAAFSKGPRAAEGESNAGTALMISKPRL